MIDLRLGDCLDVLATLDGLSVDSVVTDPPYGINFMGKAWDGAAIAAAVATPRDVSHVQRLTGGIGDTSRKLTTRTASGFQTAAGEAGAYDFSVKGNRAFQAWCERWASECLRVLKPGGHLVSFGGTRTYHRLASGVEDAGFEIRDQLAWMFGSGFPKSLDVAKAIDAKLGAEREVSREAARPLESGGVISFDQRSSSERERRDDPVTAAAAAAAAGWGTALKPGYEPIVLARKPLSGTVAATVMEHGTGALNIDGCRIETSEEWDGGGPTVPRENGIGFASSSSSSSHDLGRWPANVVLDEEAADMVDAQSGELTSGANPTRRGTDKFRGIYGDFAGQEECEPARGQDVGGASRFYYCAKVSSDERHQGLAEPSLFTTDAPDANRHPTVKPIDLMRWLCRLVTPPGGLIVDPFLGSGTTGIAAALEGFRFLGIEREPDYMRIAEARISHWATVPVEAA